MFAQLRLPVDPRFGQAAGATSVYLVTSPEVAEVTGRYFEHCTPVESSALSRDPTAADRLWRLYVRLSGLDADPPRAGVFEPGT